MKVFFFIFDVVAAESKGERHLPFSETDPPRSARLRSMAEEKLHKAEGPEGCKAKWEEISCGLAHGKMSKNCSAFIRDPPQPTLLYIVLRTNGAAFTVSPLILTPTPTRLQHVSRVRLVPQAEFLGFFLGPRFDSTLHNLPLEEPSGAPHLPGRQSEMLRQCPTRVLLSFCMISCSLASISKLRGLHCMECPFIGLLDDKNGSIALTYLS